MKRCIVLLFIVANACMPQTGQAPVEEYAECQIDNGPCSKKYGGVEIVLDITPKPVTTMRELKFSIRPDMNMTAESLVLDLSMPGMYMGTNEIILKRSTDGTYSGTGIIPRCPKGHKLWKATIIIPGHGTVPYFFNVNK